MLTTLRAADGAIATVTHYGAQVAGWQPANQPERLFLSSASPIDSGVALRGGVPVIFPQFSGFGPLPKHGFARNLVWQRRALTESHCAVFELRDSDESRAIWPHQFLAELTVSVANSELLVELKIYNSDVQPFSFTAALHTYLRVNDISDVQVVGLHGTRYRDSVAGGEYQESAGSLSIDGQFDRIYMDAPSTIQVVQSAHRFEIHSSGFADAVVWNPGKQLSDAMADMESDGYRHMLCVEAAQVVRPIQLEPGQSWSGSQRLKSIMM